MIGQGMHGFVDNKEIKIDNVEEALREPTDKRILSLKRLSRLDIPSTRFTI